MQTVEKLTGNRISPASTAM